MMLLLLDEILAQSATPLASTSGFIPKIRSHLHFAGFVASDIDDYMTRKVHDVLDWVAGKTVAVNRLTC